MKLFFKLALLIALLLVLISCATDDDDDDDTTDGDDDTDDDDDDTGDDDTSDDDDDTGDDYDDDDDDDIPVYECNEANPDWTVGLKLCRTGASEGYTLFAPLHSKTTYLIDMMGRLIHTWESDYKPGLSSYLLEDGSLLRTAFIGDGVNTTFQAGGNAGRLERFDWDGNLIWEYEYSNIVHMSHHDVEMLPNGNVLMIAWEFKSGAQAIAEGRDPGFLWQGNLWPDHLIEVVPVGDSDGVIVWEWHLWDHLIQDFDSSKPNYGDPAQHPELVDLNYGFQGGVDWNHTNSVDYNQELDQIVLSVHDFNEFWVIDHSTTMAEAAGHTGGNYGKGGDLLYRWGNPQAYRAGTDQDQRAFQQHDAQWIPEGYPGEGNFLYFNNGWFRLDGSYSSVEEVVPPVDEFGNYHLDPGFAYAPSDAAWMYTSDPVTDFFSTVISGTHRLPNGNTLICNGVWGQFFEVTPEKEIVWDYINPVILAGPVAQGSTLPPDGFGTENNVFKMHRYSPDYPGLAGRDLTPAGYVELPGE